MEIIAIDHIGIAVDSSSDAFERVLSLLGLQRTSTEKIFSQGTAASFIEAPNLTLEAVSPLNASGPIQRYLNRHGGGLHHIAFKVRNIDAAYEHCIRQGLRPLSDEPTHGARGKKVFFLHPKQTAGILIEFCATEENEGPQPPIETHHAWASAYADEIDVSKPLPRIGITTSMEGKNQVLNIEYVDAIRAAGGLPVILPAISHSQYTYKLLRMIDGLIVTGGPGILVGLEEHLRPGLSVTPSIRTAADQRILQMYFRMNKPFLGICYGMQLFNVHFGGSLYASVEVERPDTIRHKYKRGICKHPLVLEEDTRLGQWIAACELDVVNSIHVQAIKRLASPLRAVAYSPDGVIEAIEYPDRPWYGTQFHPEKMLPRSKALFRHFVEQVREGVSNESEMGAANA